MNSKMKRIAVNVTVAMGLALALSAMKVSAYAEDHERNSNDDARIRRGFEIAPVPLNMDDKDHDLVGLGSYLVNATNDCSGCHTQPTFADGGNPYMHQPKQANVAHYLAGGQHFGPFVSRNLTPENGLPAGHTFKEFLTILRTGKDFDHAHPLMGDLLQVMPWPAYQDMTTHDIRAIYEYLRAIPPATPGP